METEETLTPGPPQTKKKGVFLSETILWLRWLYDHERYSYLGPYYAFVTFKRLLKIRNFFLSLLCLNSFFGKKSISVSSLHHSALMYPSCRDFPFIIIIFPSLRQIHYPSLTCTCPALTGVGVSTGFGQLPPYQCCSAYLISILRPQNNIQSSELLKRKTNEKQLQKFFTLNEGHLHANEEKYSAQRGKICHFFSFWIPQVRT